MDQKQATDIDIAVGRRVSVRRKEMNVSQQALGRELGVSFQQIQKYEKGASRISAGRLFQIAKALNISLLYLYADVLGRAGFAEEAAAAPSPNANAQVRELNETFARIHDRTLRKQLIEIAKSLAEKSETRR